MFSALYGQKFELSVNSGLSLTYIPDFTSYIAIANDGLIIPGFINIANSKTPILFCEAPSEVTIKPTFFADMELRYKITNRVSLTFSAGYSQLKYDYDTYINTEGTPQVKLSDISSDYGNTIHYYINLKPLNVTMGFLENKLTIQGGATLNFQIKSEYSNVLIIYSQELVGDEIVYDTERVYFNFHGNPSKFLYGIHMRAEYDIAKVLSLFISGQYFFKSIYHSDSKSSQINKMYIPFLLQAGFGFKLWKF
nr:hypothetical protein [Bacteroidota bacterium]